MRLPPAVRISIGLVSLTISLLLVGQLLGFLPDRTKAILESRKTVSEIIASQVMAASQKGDLVSIRNTLELVINRGGDIRSAALRSTGGELLIEVGAHAVNWLPPTDENSTPTHVQIPIFRDKQRWATVEISFAPLVADSFLDRIRNSFVSLLLFMCLSGFVGYYFFMKNILRALDPSAVIPARVRTAFDILKEGLLILDEKEQIVLANSSFAETFGTTPVKLIGVKGSDLGWQGYNTPSQRQQLPWVEVLRQGNSRMGCRLIMNRDKKADVIFMANAAPVMDAKGKPRGVLVTLDNVTTVEQQNIELNRTVSMLQLATDDVHAKNRELEFLANHDPLTLLLNRRALQQQFDILFNEAQQQDSELSCIMCDIDKFKLINDRFGHPTGDKVIKMVAGRLQKNARESDLVGRLGGEEFCVVLPGLDVSMAASMADRIRLAISEDNSIGVNVTMSFGVSSLRSNAQNPEALGGQADKALYIAKESGRNRVVCWGDTTVPAKAAEQQPLPVASEVADRRGSPPAEVDLTTALVENDDEITRLTNRVQELEELAGKRLQELQHYTTYDALTGLPTRALFQDRILQALARGRRNNTIVATLFMSVDAVQRINETIGHEAGDRLCKEICKRLIGTIRSMDTQAKLPAASLTPTVARLGLEDFGILLTDLEDVNVITWFVKHILSAFKPVLQIDAHKIYAKTNIGIALFPYDGNSPDELEKNASAAKSHAKSHKETNRYYYYSENIHTSSIKYLNIESQLHRAVKNNEFIIHYQPVVDAATRTITSMEALIRWDNPQSGVVPLDEIISVAEYSGLIITIGEWVLATVCQQIRSWLDLGLDTCQVAVNLSSRQFRQKDLATAIKNNLLAHNINPGLLTVEITESSMMEDVNTSITILENIRTLGVGISLDDFGTGYSSLAYLKGFPLTHLKIDRSFVLDIETNEKDATLVRSIINMAHGMGLKVTAEGVETEAQVNLLQGWQCDELQGFFFSRPIPVAEVTALLTKRSNHGLPIRKETVSL